MELVATLLDGLSEKDLTLKEGSVWKLVTPVSCAVASNCYKESSRHPVGLKEMYLSHFEAMFIFHVF